MYAFDRDDGGLRVRRLVRFPDGHLEPLRGWLAESDLLATRADAQAESLLARQPDGLLRRQEHGLLDQPELKATRGKKETTDHPPIYPTQAIHPGALEGPKKRVYSGIYLLEGDKLKVCYALSGKARPTAFATKPGSGAILFVLER